MKPIDNASVLVTGGSKGIGLAIAWDFARHGHNLILVAWGRGELEQAASAIRGSTGNSVETFAMDLCRENAAEQLFETVSQAGLSVDILVNNAGTGMTGSFAEGGLFAHDGHAETQHACAQSADPSVPATHAGAKTWTHPECRFRRGLFLWCSQLVGLCRQQTLCARLKQRVGAGTERNGGDGHGSVPGGNGDRFRKNCRCDPHASVPGAWRLVCRENCRRGLPRLPKWKSGGHPRCFQQNTGVSWEASSPCCRF